jgi:hypothetical protein
MRDLRGQRYLASLYYGVMIADENGRKKPLKPDPDLATKLHDIVMGSLPYWDYDQTLEWYESDALKLPDLGQAFLACNDRYFLLVHLLGRVDLKHPWLFDRAREVEANPDGFIDLWARFHGKSSIITCGGIIQEVLTDPEQTIAIFSVTKPIAREFLAQIKNEFETNDRLKDLFPDVLYANPRGKGVGGERPAKWSLERGITVQRKGRPKEATIEAHGLIDAQPTSRHFNRHAYDDIVTQDYLSDDLLKKTTERFEMADNLGTRHGVTKWIAGTRYHFADAYGVILERGSAKRREYAATRDGTLNGELVLLEPEHWEKIKRDQGQKTVSAQMLLNPLAGGEATFNSLWLRSYDVVPRILNIYILVDPSMGTGQRSDRTAIAVIGIDPAGNKYLLDGVCHRMRLTDRLAYVERYKGYWENLPGVQATVKVGWERYGKDVELEVVEDILLARDAYFKIEELNTPRQGGHSKRDRIGRLEPDIRSGRFYLPCIVHHWEFGPKIGAFAGCCYWSVWSEEDKKRTDEAGQRSPHHVGQIVYRQAKGLTRSQREYEQQSYRIVTPLKRQDENKEIYDLTRVFIDELIRHPFAAHDDLIDACARIYDIDPKPPQQVDAKAAEGIDYDDHVTGQPGEEPVGYDD